MPASKYLQLWQLGIVFVTTKLCHSSVKAAADDTETN